MNRENFEKLLRSAEQMAAFESGSGKPPSRQTTYVGKLLVEVKVNGNIAWCLSDAFAELKAEVRSRPITSYGELIRAMMDILNQSDEGFAQLLEVPVGTVRGWKSGRRKLPCTAQKLLRISIDNPDIVFNYEEQGEYSFA